MGTDESAKATPQLHPITAAETVPLAAPAPEGKASSAPTALSTQELAERLAPFLADQAGLRDALPVRAVERIGQGQSNLTFRVTLAAGDVILRRPPYGPLPPSAHDVLREYRV